MTARAIERLADANANRACEGLRAIEDVARFVLDAADLAGTAKGLRHAVRQAVPAVCVLWRDSGADVGETIKAADEGRRADLVAVVRANAVRAQEALRALEEAAKLAGWPSASAIETARYGAYRIEAALLSRLPAWRLGSVRLYALIDTALCPDPVQVAAAAARGGAGAIQLRAKSLDVRAYRDLAARTQEAIAGRALFVVNDHVAVARILDADAVHVGQHDLAVADARLVVGPRCAIGLSAHTPEQARAAQDAGADYLGLGPMYATSTKPHEPERGPQLLDAVRGFLTRPSYAIGGLDAARIRDLLPRLPHGVAVAGAICRATDPERVTAELLRLVEPA